jgi:hypothetical protein
MIQRGCGVIALFLGLGLLGWVGYNVLVEEQPSARGHSPIPPVITSLVLVTIGTWLVRSGPWLTWEKVFRPIFGILAIAIGLAQLAWVGYNLFVERQPEWRRPLIWSAVPFVMIVVGLGWFRRNPPGPPSPNQGSQQTAASSVASQGPVTPDRGR